MSLKIVEHAERSDTGRVRSTNEDSYLVRSPLFVVADGMGGASAGEVASRMAVEAFAAGLPAGSDPEQQMGEVVRSANSLIHREAQADASRRGMGTTVTATLVGDGTATVAHVGDSRAYLIRDGSIEQLTRDHTLVDELVRQGRLTPEEAAAHPQRSIITRALGPEPQVEVDTSTHELLADDVLLLCSDGLTGMLDEQSVLRTVTGAKTLTVACRSLIKQANEAGGRDNITAVLIRVGESSSVRTAARPSSSKGGAGGAAGSQASSHGRRRVAMFAASAAAIVLVLIGAGAWRASQAVFFLGVDQSGTVAVYRGLPYELPLGLNAYEPWFVSGVPLSTVPPERRSLLLDHTLRTKNDAADFVSSLERGEIKQ
ncbi:MAG: Stp1/IreP family PP2C-type Ser/Thr phosphatase [Actinomycetes bacterium]